VAVLKIQKRRLDQLLVDRGLVENKTRAQAIVMAGLVLSGTHRLDKPGHKVNVDIPLIIKGLEHPWVSRGGVKLAHGLDYFNINPEGLVSLDIGASTGGFTDVLLNSFAKKVYAVDVGYGQLAWKISQDERVVVLDKTNARYLCRDQVPELVDLVVCDASFIGLEVILPASMALTAPRAHMIALIKPQFEVGRGNVGSGGVVRDKKLHYDVIKRLQSWINEQCGWSVLGVTESPLKGADGNKEFLIATIKGSKSHQNI
jgi:23S rRNA (cytidine1920-2'-O)/16S rRNA (cytidine1409-2'-O)-methyltransferase